MRLLIGIGVILIVLVLAYRVMGKGRRARGRTFGVGPGAAGTVYDMLNEDKRKAIEIIVEGRAEYRDPETADDKPRTGTPKP